jgi:hypothetical protein
MNDNQQAEQQTEPTKLEWLEPSFELLSNPEGGGSVPSETSITGAS